MIFTCKSFIISSVKAFIYFAASRVLNLFSFYDFFLKYLLKNLLVVNFFSVLLYGITAVFVLGIRIFPICLF